MSAQQFVIPVTIPVANHMGYCKQILVKQQKELHFLRLAKRYSESTNKRLEKEILQWREKYKTLRDDLQKVEKENTTLRKEIEKLTKTNNRYSVSLFDHGNFTHPQGKHAKPNGGQVGHSDTNQDKQRNYSSFKKQRLFATQCGICGSSLFRANGVKEKILIDTQINTELIKVVFQSERQWCGTCRKEVTARSTESLPFTEYGMNTFMTIMLLRFTSHSSIKNISRALSFGFGLSISKSAILNILRQAKGYLGSKYEELKQAIREGQVMYADETGWMVKGQKAWMWIMVNEETTVYVAAESRGKGIAEELYGNTTAFAMTDGLASYMNVIPKNKHLYCWAHILRFAFEETVNEKEQTSLACKIRDRLVKLYQNIRNHPKRSKREKKEILKIRLTALLSIKSENQTVRNILQRLSVQKQGLILSLLETEDGTNNLSERELRNMAIKRSISNGSQTFKGMERTAVLGSIVQTIARNKEKQFLPILKGYFLAGIREIYPQYLHPVSFDT